MKITQVFDLICRSLNNIILGTQFLDIQIEHYLRLSTFGMKPYFIYLALIDYVCFRFIAAFFKFGLWMYLFIFI